MPEPGNSKLTPSHAGDIDNPARGPPCGGRARVPLSPGTESPGQASLRTSAHPHKRNGNIQKGLAGRVLTNHATETAKGRSLFPLSSEQSTHSVW